MNMIQHSEEIRAGLRQGFRDGTSKLAQRKCYGCEVSADGELVIKVSHLLPASQNGIARQSTACSQMRSKPTGRCCKRQRAAGTIRER